MCAGLTLWDKRFTGFLFWDRPLGKALGIPNRPTSEEEEDARRKWKIWMTKVAVSKRLFITKGGRLGLAPHAAAVGDLIAIFASSDLPFVLRKVRRVAGKDAHILLGSCYLDGEISPTDLQAVFER
jgi:hypothetical protein